MSLTTIFIAVAIAYAINLVFIGLAIMRSPDAAQLRLDFYGTRIRTLEEIELEQPFSARILRPALRSIARLVMRLAPQVNLDVVQHRLELAGNPNNWTAADFLGVRGISGIVFGLAALAILLTRGVAITSVILVAIAFGGLGLYVPVVWLGRRIRKRQHEIQRHLPDALDLLTVSVEAGLTFEAGMAKVAEKWDNELSRAFGRAISEVQVGKRRADALRDMAERSGVPDLTNFVTALIQAEQLGVSTAKILRIQSDEMRVKRRQRAEEQAHRAPIKMSIVMVSLLLPALILIILGPAVPRLCRQFFSEIPYC